MAHKMRKSLGTLHKDARRRRKGDPVKLSVAQRIRAAREAAQNKS